MRVFRTLPRALKKFIKEVIHYPCNSPPIVESDSAVFTVASARAAAESAAEDWRERRPRRGSNPDWAWP